MIWVILAIICLVFIFEWLPVINRDGQLKRELKEIGFLLLGAIGFWAVFFILR